METLCHQKLLYIPLLSLIIIISANAQCISPNCISLEPAMAPNMEPVASPGPEPVPSPAPTVDPSLDIFSVPGSTSPSSQSNPSSLFADQLSVKVPSLPDIAELKKICDKTDYPSLCLSSISPFLKDKFDTLTVLEMAIKASTEQTKLAISTIAEMAGAPGTPSQTATTLNDCKNSYTDATDNFQKAMDAFPARDVGTMNSMLSAAITDYGDCDDEFTGQTSPMAAYSEKLTHMVSNCLAIVSLI